MPLLDLDVVGCGTTSDRVAVDEATKRVATFISTVRVHLSSTIVGVHVDQLLVDVSDNLNVSGGLHELEAGDRASGNDTSAVAGLRAPCNGCSFGGADVTSGSGRSPDTPIIRSVDVSGLAVGGRSFGGGVADVVCTREESEAGNDRAEKRRHTAELGATTGWVGIDLVWLKTDPQSELK